MSFPKCSIYGLLGPSGCGKTTLLKLIIGLLRPKSGTIEVNGRRPNHRLNKIPGYGVGFQPQEIGLYMEFSIQETLNYFAEIYGMEANAKKQRIEFLVNFLDLPVPNSKIKNMSGGQQRRVSLAVAIVHNPPFLILDEPTVGVDPMLREKIWEHLVELSKVEKTSILITTHYIEEARRAHVIAMVRSGKLLVEQTPKNLLNHFAVNNLEDVFLKVCMAQEVKEMKPTMPKSFYEEGLEKGQTSKPSDNKAPVLNRMGLKPNYWKRFCILFNKNYIRLIRNLLMLTFQILSPTLTMILFCICIGSVPENLKVALYNGEAIAQKSGETLPQHLCLHNNYSNYYIQALDKKTLQLISYSSKVLARDSVKYGKTYGALLIDKHFSYDLCMRVVSEGQGSSYVNQIDYEGDWTDITISQVIYKELMKAQMDFIKKAIPEMMYRIGESRAGITAPDDFTIPPLPPGLLSPILNIVDPPVYGSLDMTFRDFMTPGMMISIIFILSVGLTAISFVVEKKEQLLDRTLITGVKIYEILIAQILVQIFVLLVQITLLMVIIFPIFEIHNEESWGYVWIILINILQGIAGMTWGLVISIIAPDEQSALMIAFGVFFPVLLLSGVFWPLDAIKYGLKYVSYGLPQTLAVMALRNIMMKGWGLTYTWVWLGFASTVIWIIIFITLSLTITAF